MWDWLRVCDLGTRLRLGLAYGAAGLKALGGATRKSGPGFDV